MPAQTTALLYGVLNHAVRVLYVLLYVMFHSDVVLYGALDISINVWGLLFLLYVDTTAVVLEVFAEE